MACMGATRYHLCLPSSVVSYGGTVAEPAPFQSPLPDKLAAEFTIEYGSILEKVVRSCTEEPAALLRREV